MVALYQLGYKDRFSYQYPLFGGRTAKGGTVIDFYIGELNLALMIQSLYYHYYYIEDVVNDKLIRSQLENTGIRVIYIDEENLLDDAYFYVKDALAGIDHSRIVMQ